MKTAHIEQPVRCVAAHRRRLESFIKDLSFYLVLYDSLIYHDFRDCASVTSVQCFKVTFHLRHL